MKKSIAILLSLTLLILFFINSCDDGSTTTPDLTLLYGITIDDTSYDNNATYNFGVAEAENGSKTATLNLTNNGETSITVASVVLSFSVNYSISVPEMPFTAEPGDSTAVSVTFSPTASGTKTAIIRITVDGLTDPFVLNLSGEGNYPPTVKFGMTVTDAGVAGANGFYERNDFLSPLAELSPRYDKTGTTDYYSYIYNVSDTYAWCIDDSLTADRVSNRPFYDNAYWLAIPMVPPSGEWTARMYSTETADFPVITVQDITGISGTVGEELTANYYYNDTEGDAEDPSAAAFQWYSSDTVDGTYTAINGATNKTFTPDTSGVFLKVQVTPAAATGFLPGTANMSSATREIVLP